MPPTSAKARGFLHPPLSSPLSAVLVLLTGVGFIGGGAILKHSAGASGTATAASLWATGAVGGAVGYGLYDIAVILSVVTYATLRWMAPLKEVARTDDEGVSAGAQPASAADRATLRS